MCALSIASIASIASIGSTAWADGTGVIAVGPERARIAQALTSSFTGRTVDDAVAAGRAAIAAGAVPVDTMAAFAHVRDQIDQGWKAYKQVELPFAASRLASARSAAESLLALPGGVELYADATLKLGLVEAHPQLARANDAANDLRLAIALDPDRPLALSEFSPSELAAVEAARNDAQPTAKVHVSVQPVGSTVIVDGKDLGPGPIDVELARGHHVALARQALHRPAAQAFAVDQPREVALVLDADDDAVRLTTGASPGMPDAAARELVEAALRYADLDEVVIAVQGERTLRVQRCRGVPATCTSVVEVALADVANVAQAARSAWQMVQTADMREPPTGFGERAGREHRWCELCRNPYVIGGVTAAVLAGVITLAIVATRPTPPPTLVLDPGGYTR